MDAAYLFDSLDILAHLFFAVGTVDTVRVEGPGLSLEGTFRYPDRDGVEIVHEVGAVAAPPGTPVFVEYLGANDEYRFYTEVLHAGPGVLRVAMPTAIDCADRRLTRRVPVSPDAGVALHLASSVGYLPVPIRDLSDGGVGYLDTIGWELTQGQRLFAVLVLQGEGPLQIELEVRHVRAEPAGRVVGARFTSLALADRARLAHFLVRGAQARLAG